MTRRLTGAIERAVFSTVVNATGDEPTITISTGSVDREGDILVPSGAELDPYRQNPVVLFAHDHSEIPIGSTTAIEATPTGSGLRASWRWLEGDPFVDRVRNAWNQGVLRAASVGFIPLAETPIDTGTKFTKWELIEWSLCPVPANSEAVRTLKSLGLADTRDEPGGLDVAKALQIGGAAMLLGKRIAGVVGRQPASRPREASLDDVLVLDDEQIRVAGMSDAELRRTIGDGMRAALREELMRVTGRVLD